MKLLIRMPTRERPHKVLNLVPRYFQLLSGTIDVKFLLSCDANDASMTPDVLAELLSRFLTLRVHYGESGGKIAAYNRDCHLVDDWHIMVVTSDDMVPVVHGYDRIIVDAMTRSFPDTDGVLHFNDGFVGPLLNTLPIVGRRYFNRFGYVYHPSYHSLWADNEFTDVARMLNKTVYIDQTIIRHEHPVNTRAAADSLYVSNEQHFARDAAVYRDRKANGFGLQLPDREQVAHSSVDFAADDGEWVVGVLVPYPDRLTAAAAAADTRHAGFRETMHVFLPPTVAEDEEVDMPTAAVHVQPACCTSADRWWGALDKLTRASSSPWILLLSGDKPIQSFAPAALSAGIRHFGARAAGFGLDFAVGADWANRGSVGWVEANVASASPWLSCCLSRRAALDLLAQRDGRVLAQDAAPPAVEVTRYIRARKAVWYAHNPNLTGNVRPSAVESSFPAAVTDSALLLSVLIATVDSRRVQLSRLLDRLQQQVQANQLEDSVELLTFLDDRQFTVGHKRNQLLREARGRFVAFVDDDDDVDDTYIPLLCDIIRRRPDIDCIGFIGEMTWAGRRPELSVYSLRHDDYATLGALAGHYVYLRPPLHLNPMRREIALRYAFADTNCFEDVTRSRQMARDGALRNEMFVNDRILYRYLFDPARTIAQQQ